MVKELGAPPPPPPPQLGFHGVIPEDSFRLRHAILLPAAKMCCLFWLSLLWSSQVALWGEGDGERKGGVKVQTKKAPIGTPFSVIKFVETQKRATVSFPRTSWEGREKGVIGQHSLCQSFSSSLTLSGSYSQSSLCSWTNCSPLCQRLNCSLRS